MHLLKRHPPPSKQGFKKRILSRGDEVLRCSSMRPRSLSLASKRERPHPCQRPEVDAAFLPRLLQLPNPPLDHVFQSVLETGGPSLPPRMGVRALRGEGSEEVGFPVGAGLAPIRLMCKGQASRMHGSCPMRLLRPSTTRPSSRTGKRYASLVTAARIIFLICFSPPRFLSYGTRAAPC